MSSYIDSDMTPIGRLLSSDFTIQVPDNQRSFAWTDEEVRQLWQDVIEAIDTKQPEYFLGPMVFKKGHDFYEIIDGQQRITTILIIFSIIRRVLRANGDDRRADWFRNKYFGEQDVHTLEVKPKFRMNEENNLIFSQFVATEASISQIKQGIKGKLKKDSNYLLLNALTNLWECIEAHQKSVTGKEFAPDILLQIQDYIHDHVSILLLKVEDEADAYVIFETLNDRGLTLNTMDLLKNHIFGKSGSYIDQVKFEWTIVKDNLADIDPRERFLYHYWTSYNGRTSKSSLFRLMRDKITNHRSARSFVSDLREGARVYAALQIPTHPHWNEYDKKTRRNLEILNLLDAQQAYPILLAAAQCFPTDEFSKLTEILVVMAVRYNLICELRTGVLSNYYSEIPPKIRSGEIGKSAKVFRQIKAIYPKDDEFRDSFARRTLKDSKKARYLLSEIEKFLNDGISQIIDDPVRVNLEHVLPKNPSQEWQSTLESIDKFEQGDYIHRIGNLALVSSSLNKDAGAKGFEYKKRNIYTPEKFIHYTKQLSDYSEWNKSTIDERQSKLANDAVKVWRIDIE